MRGQINKNQLAFFHPKVKLGEWGWSREMVKLALTPGFQFRHAILLGTEVTSNDIIFKVHAGSSIGLSFFLLQCIYLNKFSLG